MIFITQDNIVEVPSWALKGNEIFSEDSLFHEILNPIFSMANNSGKYESLRKNIENQIKENKNYIDLRQLQIV